MNFLFHMYLSGSDHELMVGNFMGDFVKGPLDDRYPRRIKLGLMLHRKIDSFAQKDTSFQASRLRLSSRYGLYRGVLVDLFYDHFLAAEWDSWSRISLPEYMLWARDIIDKHRSVMPKQLQEFVPVIFDNLLPSYRYISGIESALFRMSKRVRRDNPLADGKNELILHYNAIKADFNVFVPAVQNFASKYISEME